MGYACYKGPWPRNRDQGYGVPAKCDYPGCDADIDRGIAYACGGDPMENCGLFFCYEHKRHDVDPEAEWSDENRHQFGVCERCAKGEPSFDPSPDTPEWVHHKLTDDSWAQWRAENPEWVTDNRATTQRQVNPAAGLGQETEGQDSEALQQARTPQGKEGQRATQDRRTRTRPAS